MTRPSRRPRSGPQVPSRDPGARSARPGPGATVLEAHGDRRVDDWYWLAHRDDPEVLAHLGPRTPTPRRSSAPWRTCARSLFAEMRARIVETDLSVPVRRGPWWYYERTVEGRDYIIHCRRPVAGRRPDRDPAEVSDHAVPDEQVLLDENVLAEGHDYLEVGNLAVSPDHRRLAYATGHHRGRALQPELPRPRGGEDDRASRSRATPTTGWPGPTTTPPSSTPGPTPPCAPTSSGATASASPARRTCSWPRRTTSASTWAWAGPRTMPSSWSRRSHDHLGGPRHPGRPSPRRRPSWSSPAARASSTGSSTTTGHVGGAHQRRRRELSAGGRPGRRPGAEHVDRAHRPPARDAPRRPRRLRRPRRQLERLEGDAPPPGHPARPRGRPVGPANCRGHHRAVPGDPGGHRGKGRTPSSTTGPALQVPRSSPRARSTTSISRPASRPAQAPARARRLRPGPLPHGAALGRRRRRDRGADVGRAAAPTRPRRHRARASSTATAPTSTRIDPVFSSLRPRLLERGFVFAIAHVRGGGELGSPLVRGRQAAGQAPHLRRLRRLRPRTWSTAGLTIARPPGRPRRLGRRAAHGGRANLAPELFAPWWPRSPSSTA